MKIIISLSFVCFLFFIFCSDKNDNKNKSRITQKSSVALQEEMLNILERNITNPDNALKKLDNYYNKYSSVLKKQLRNAKTHSGNVSNEYKESISEKEKTLLKRQQKAIKEILKREPNFNMKLMLLMKKHGLTSGY